MSHIRDMKGYCKMKYANRGIKIGLAVDSGARLRTKRQNGKVLTEDGIRELLRKGAMIEEDASSLGKYAMMQQGLEAMLPCCSTRPSRTCSSS
jgi:hypothetical protein